MEKKAFPRCVGIHFGQEEPAPVAYAAEELERYLTKAGVAVRPGMDYTILLKTGETGLPDGAYRVRCGEKRTVIAAEEAIGIVYGTYGFLERLGFRFLAPDCDVIPEKPDLPEGEYEDHPAFMARELFWREAMDGAFAVRLKLNSARSSITPRQGGKLPFYNFSHTFNQLVPPERWFDSHPEYFSEREGKRLRERTQLCLTNPDVLRLCIEGVERWIAKRPDCRIFSVSMNDWYNNCECAACRKIDGEEGSAAGTVIRFVNAVAEAVEKKHPGVMIHTFAYLYCRKPPRYVRPRRNVIVRLCSIECCFSHPIEACGRERGSIDVQYGSAANFSDAAPAAESFAADLAGWARICDNLYIWDYTTNYANYLLPFPNLGVLQPNLRLFRRNGVRGVLEQGNFSHGHPAALGQLKTYLLGKLLWNPDENIGMLTEDFLTGYYGRAAGTMSRYVCLWRQAAEDGHAGIYDMPDAAYLTEERLLEAEALLRQAAEESLGTDAHPRVEREALSVRYALLAREDPETEGHAEAVERFRADAERLGITELFERKNWEDSIELLKRCRYTRHRGKVRGITYPI